MLSRFSDFENTFALMDELQRRMDRIWEDVDPSWRSWQPASPSSRALSASAFPRINLFDAGSNLVLKADVPGLSEKDVQVTLGDGGIALSGERKVVAPQGYYAHRQERSQLKFSRSMTLPSPRVIRPLRSMIVTPSTRRLFDFIVTVVPPRPLLWNGRYVLSA